MVYVSAERRRFVSQWLYTIAFLVLAMLTLGGLTRLTGSGLSMVEWRPLMGAIPPLNQADWQEVFALYQQYPEYKLHNHRMTLGEFEFIFMMEYSHRLLGRFIGLVFFLPMVFFFLKGWLSSAMKRRCLFLFFLGGLQGVVGWYMVKSGLVDVPRVSQYRLTLHLLLAAITLTLSLWYAFDLRPAPAEAEQRNLAPLSGGSLALLWLIAAQITSGGFVAGLKAGFAYNTFPSMNGSLIPPGLFDGGPWLLNFLENPVTVQFVHRWLAMVVAVAVLIFFFRHRKAAFNSHLKPAMIALPCLLLIQVGLGIATLLLVVPTGLASAHQVVAMLLWSTAIYIRHGVARNTA